MKPLSDVEKIAAAIARLEEVRSGYFVMNGWLCELVTTGIEPNPTQEPNPLTNDVFMVTLHETVSAQLAMLHDQYDICSVPFAGLRKIPDEHVLALAEAILKGHPHD